MKKIYVLFFITLFVTLIPQVIFAATLSVSSAKSSYTVGDTFPVSIIVDSGNQAINAISSTLSLPNDILSITSISKANSVIKFWAQEPIFSNTTGTASLEGVVLNPGFTGKSGNVVTLNLKAKKAGMAKLSLSNASVLANDGEGTNVLTSVFGKTITIGNSIPQESVPAPVNTSTLDTPAITSTEWPESTAWYKVSEGTLAWEIPENASAYFAFDKKQNTVPIIRKGNLSSYQVSVLSDGIYYFHLRFKNAKGYSDTAHYAVQIDTHAPDTLVADLLPSDDPMNPNISWTITSTDALSGVDHLAFSIGQNPPAVFPISLDNTYTLPPLPAGNYTFSISVFDKAGNVTSVEKQAVILPVPKPSLIVYPETIRSGETLLVKGLTLPNTEVHINLAEETGGPTGFSKVIIGLVDTLLPLSVVSPETIVTSDGNGLFVFQHEGRLQHGEYTFEARAVTKHGAQSEPASTTFRVLYPWSPLKALSDIGNLAVLTMWLLLVLIIAYILSKFVKLYIRK